LIQRNSGGRVPLVPIKSVSRPCGGAVRGVSVAATGTVGSLQQSAREHGQREVAQRVPTGRLAVSDQSRGNREYIQFQYNSNTC